MQNREIKKQIQSFQDLVNRTNGACHGNLELQAEWARYLCVLAAGILENAIKEIYGDFAERKVTSPVAKYVGSTLSPIRSPRTVKFLEIAGAFSAAWQSELEIYVNDNGGLDAVDSIMAQRHLIAHGKYKNSNITMARIKNYFERAVKVLELIEEQCRR